MYFCVYFLLYDLSFKVLCEKKISLLFDDCLNIFCMSVIKDKGVSIEF